MSARTIIFTLIALALGIIVAVSCDASQQVPTQPQPPVTQSAPVLVAPAPGFRPVLTFINGRPYVVYVPAAKVREGGLRGLIFGNVYRY